MFKCQLPNESPSSFPSLVCFLLANNVSMDTAFFFKNNKYPAGIHEVKVNLPLKQEADSFSLTTTHIPKKKKNPASQQSVHTSVSIRPVNHTWAAGCSRVKLPSGRYEPVICRLQSWFMLSWCVVTLAQFLAGKSSDRDTHSSSLTTAETHSFWLNCHFPWQTLSGLMAVTSKAGASTASVLADKVVQAAWFCQV